jgi:hypothetical protein
MSTDLLAVNCQPEENSWVPNGTDGQPDRPSFHDMGPCAHYDTYGKYSVVLSVWI